MGATPMSSGRHGCHTHVVGGQDQTFTEFTPATRLPRPGDPAGSGAYLCYVAAEGAKGVALICSVSASWPGKALVYRDVIFCVEPCRRWYVPISVDNAFPGETAWTAGMEQRGIDDVDVPPRPVYGARILVVDGDEAIREILYRALAAEGLSVELAATAEEGLRRTLVGAYDLVILELLMPGMDGFVMLRQLLRDRPNQTVLVLSCLADVRYKVTCLDLGARDYLTKPFSLAELIARVRNQLRADGFDRVLRVGKISLHAGRMEVNVGDGPVPLTKLEFLVLKVLMQHAGQSVSRKQLLESVWGYDFKPDSNIVGVCVRRLRSKIGNHLITTMRGEGYQLGAG
jgi:DNA-binding response OmpR family regulator